MRRMFFKVSEKFYQFDNVDGFIDDEKEDNWDTTVIDHKDTIIPFGSDYDTKDKNGNPIVLPNNLKHRQEAYIHLNLIGNHSTEIACYVCQMKLISNTMMRLSFIVYSFDDVSAIESSNEE